MNQRNMRAAALGFTLFELMIALTMLAILVTFGLPAFDSMLERRRLTGVVEDVRAQIVLARSEAQKRNETISVAFTRTDNDTWCLGLSNTLPAGCDCTEDNPGAADFCDFDDGVNTATQQRIVFDGDQVLLAAAPSFGGDAVFAIDPSTSSLAGLETGTIALTSEDDGAAGTYAATLTVNPLGMVSVCLPTGSGNIGFYEACP